MCTSLNLLSVQLAVYTCLFLSFTIQVLLICCTWSTVIRTISLVLSRSSVAALQLLSQFQNIDLHLTDTLALYRMYQKFPGGHCRRAPPPPAHAHILFFCFFLMGEGREEFMLPSSTVSDHSEHCTDICSVTKEAHAESL